MINLKLTSYLLLVIIGLSSCGGSSKSAASGIYIVDSSIRKEMDKKLQAGEETKVVEFKLYKDGRSVKIPDNLDQCMTHTSVKDGKVNIYFMAVSFICQITIFNDSCTVIYFPKSDKDIYKLNQGDSLATHVAVPCKTYKVTLAKKPAFKADEIFEGTVELTSEEYYEVVDGQEARCKVQLTGYFKAQTSQMELFMPKGNN